MNKLLSWLGSICGIIGALLVATATNMTLGYELFLVSSISWTVVGYSAKSYSLLSMNIVFTIINMIGLYTYISKGL